MAERKTVARIQRVLLRVVLVCLIGLQQARAQSPVLQGIIGDVNPDTLLTTLRVLTGEVGSTHGGQSDTIVSRGYRMPGKTLAASFLERWFVGVGLPVRRDSFYTSVPSRSGTNILAEQQGIRFPLQKYILCAHYDATAEDTRDSVAPGADDNATGVAAVLEATRLLSRYQTDYTVLYALWDCEEAGTVGSDAYAQAARARGDSILAVVNLDMLGTDTNDDSLMYVAGGTARELADTVAQLCQLYQIGLKPALRFPGIQSSDHASFIRQKYPAIMLTEFSPTDFSPVNHTSLDRIDRLNLDYFHRQTKLVVATIAFLAGVSPLSSTGAATNVAAAFWLEQNYPNPFNPTTTIEYHLPEAGNVRLVVFDLLGRQVAELASGPHQPGVYSARWDATSLSGGVYYARLTVTGELGRTWYAKAIKLLLVK
jgi:hypothetical protein